MLAESPKDSAVFCPLNGFCGIELVPEKTSSLQPLAGKSCSVYAKNFSKCEQLVEELKSFDVDECEMQNIRCGNDSGNCVNLINQGYDCPCFSGFKRVLYDSALHCEDINECLLAEDVCAGLFDFCENEMGSFSCPCESSGFNRVTEESDCEDIDECNQLCLEGNEVCENNIGSYVCDCKKGFERSDDNNTDTCIDVNECATGTHECPAPPESFCFNEPGSYKCNIKFIRILGARSAETNADSTPVDVKRSYDGSEATNPPNCYVGSSQADAWLAFAIPEANLSLIRILFPDPLSGNGHFGLLTLEACTDDFNCVSCGELTSFLPGEWVSFTCPEDTTGNQIRIQNSASALQLCEVQVHGEEIRDDLIPIISARSADPLIYLSVPLSVEKAFDGWLNSSATNCFHSNERQYGWTHFSIPLSRVTQIELLNRNDEYSYQMNGASVQVCMNDSACHDCGVASNPGGGQWAIINCLNNTEGNKINITNPTDFVQFCEIRVIGKVIEDDHKYIQILGANGDAPWSGHTETVVELSHDGFEDTPYLSCFISNLIHNGWATYYISFSSVDHVIFLNRDVWSYQTNGTRIDVCTNDESCFDCGSTSETRESIWIKLQCPEGTKGNQVKVINPQNYLNVCEIKVYA